jgi:hypothetical protein
MRGLLGSTLCDDVDAAVLERRGSLSDLIAFWNCEDR